MACSKLSAAVLALTAVGAAVTGCSGSGWPRVTRSPSRAPITVHGTVVLPGGENFTYNGAGTECWSPGNEPGPLGPGAPSAFTDVKAGAQVVITNAAGVTLGVGTLSEGTASETPDETIGGYPRYPCNFGFQITGVPAGSAFYGVKVGSHSLQIPAAQIASPTVTFTS